MQFYETVTKSDNPYPVTRIVSGSRKRKIGIPTVVYMAAILAR